MKIRLNAYGIRNISKAFAAAPAAVQKRLDEAAAKNADELAGSARAMVPVLTGATRDSIAVKHEGRTHWVEATDPAAQALEWGTRKMAAQPFFYPAYRLLKKRFKGRNSRAMRQGLKDAGLDPKAVLRGKS